MKETLRYNYRLNLIAEQAAKLIEFGAYSRGLWNLLLSENIRRYKYNKTFFFYNQMAGLIKELKQFDEFAWLKAFDSAAAQQVARDLDVALKNAFSKGRAQRFPKHKITFKQKKLHNDSFRCVNNSNCIRIENGLISIPKIGQVPIVLHRKLASSIKTITIQYRHGKWSASIVQEVSCQAAKTLYTSLVGYDINSQFTVVGSNGWYVKNPKSFKQSKDKLGQLQRQLARRKQGSCRWHKTKKRINTLNGKISRQRLAFAHEVSCSIAKSSDIIVFEDLNVKSMQQFNGSMVNDNVMGLITQLVRYKAELRGNVYHEIGRFQKSSGVCNACQHPHKLSLNQRHFACEQCGTLQCRDWSAAISIANTGKNDLKAAGIVVWDLPTAQQKTAIKTKVFEASKLAVGSEKKDAA